MKNKEDYPYIAIFKTLPERIVAKEVSPEESEVILEQYIGNGLFDIMDSAPKSTTTFVEQYLSQELYDFINTVAVIEVTENFNERIYRINSLQFKIVENEIF